jgi:hypothetical protein
MRRAAARSTFFSAAALGVALVWGVVELLALQWSRFAEESTASFRRPRRIDTGR